MMDASWNETVQWFRAASGDMDAARQKLVDIGVPETLVAPLGESDRWMFAISSTLVLESVFWLCQLFYVLIDRSNLLQKYKIQCNRPYPPPELLRECIRDVFVDHLVVRPILMFLAFPLFARQLDFGQVPGWKTVLWQVLACTQIDDFLFYWSHRLAHHKLFYAAVHKQHHLFKYTLPIATEYCHPIEDLFVNTLSSVAGPLLLQTHVTVFWLYSCLKLYQSIDAHSQYVLPFPLSPWNIEAFGIDCGRAHSFHHSNNTGMYGGFTRFWDWFCGTDKHYKAHLERLKSESDRNKKTQ